MSNKVDFFQSDRSQLALAAVNYSIFIDGVLFSALELREVIYDKSDDFCSAKLVYNCSLDNSANPSQSQIRYSQGKEIIIRQSYNGDFAGSSLCSFVVFAGHIESINKSFDSNGEVLEILARDFSSKMERSTVYGKFIASQSGSVFLSDTDTIFNQNGIGNAARDTIKINAADVRLFASDTTQAISWTAGEIIFYLLNMYVCDGQVVLPELSLLEELTEGQILRDLDLSQMSLLSALKKCCQQVGLLFKFKAVITNEQVKQAIVFYDEKLSRQVELNLQYPGEKLSVFKSNIRKYYIKDNASAVTNRYIAQGDFKTFEATFDLVAGWDNSLEDTDRSKFDRSSGQFYTVSNVFRRWCLNESGSYGDDVFDFSTIFNTCDYQKKNRKFLPALTCYSNSQSLGYFLEISLNRGTSWTQYGSDFDVLDDQCGIWLSSDQLNEDMFNAAVTGQLRFRITASVKSDDRLCCEIADGPVNSAAQVVDNIIRDQTFKFSKVSRFSRFFDEASAEFENREVNDQLYLYEFLRKRLRQINKPIEYIDVEMPYLYYGFEVGDEVICSPDSKDVLQCRNNNSSSIKIAKICMDFKNQCSKLKLARKRILAV